VTAAPDLPFHRATTGTVRAESVALKVGGAIGAVVLGLVVLVFVLGEAGPIGLAIGLFAAVLPAPLYLALGLRIDRYEPEPVGMLLGAFAWGATAAVVIALVLNTAAGLIVGSSYGEQTGELFAGNVSAPIVEEAAKALVLLAIYRWRRNELNGVLDGLVYAAMVGLGFATTENVLYYARAAVEGQVTLVFVLRGVLSPFAHPVFTAMTGIGIALAVQARQPEVRVIAVVGGLLGAIALHSLWNTSTGLLGGLGFLLAYLLVFVPVFVAILVTVGYARRRELQTVGRELRHEVRTGLLPAGELAALSSPTVRRHALRRARKVGAKGLRKRFHVTATELAFLREQAHQGRYVGAGSPAEQDAAYQHELRRLQEELAARAAGAPPPPP